MSVQVATERLRAVAGRRRRRGAVVGAGLGALVVAVAASSVSVGELPVSPRELVAVMVGRGDETATLVLLEFRLPRLVLGALVGAALGLAGGLFQAVLRNPLASPDVIGVTQGASVGAVTALLVLGLSGAWVALAALAGAGAVVAIDLALAWRGGLAGHRFVLSGVGLAFVATSVLGYLITRSDVRDVQTALVWLSGSVSAATWEGNARLALALAVLVPVALAQSGRVRMLGLGDDTAYALGVRSGRVRVAALLTGTALAAAATAAAGPVAFVALVSAPIARRLLRDGRAALATGGLVGALLVTAADLVAQHLLPGVAAPVGVVTGLVGGGYLIWLLATTAPGGTR